MIDGLGLLARSTLWLSAGIVLVVAVRLPVRRLFGTRAAYALWLIPLAALAASLLPPLGVRADGAAASVSSVVSSVPPALPRTIAAAETAVLAPVTARAAGAPASLAQGLFAIWLAGVFAAFFAAAFRQYRFVAALGHLRREPGGHPAIFRAGSAAGGPALVGVLRPRVILPADFESRFTAEERPLVIAHELAHLRAGDAQVNALVAAVRALCWFNPLVFAASRLLRLDQELSCDAAVMSREPAGRRHYANAMVKAQHLDFAGLPLASGWTAGGPHPLSRRLAMLKRPIPGRPRRWAGVAAAIGLAAASGVTIWAAQLPRPIPAAHHAAAGPGPYPAQHERVPELRPAPWTAILTAMFPGAHHTLLDAVQDDDIDAVRELLASGADVNVNVHRPGDGTPLVEASRAGNIAMVTLLLDHGADPDVPAPGDGNPLIIAAARGHGEVVRLLVGRGADVNGYVPGDETPLINAAGAGHLGVVKYLVEQGADVNLAIDVRTFRGTTERRSPLGQAVRRGHREVADFLRSVGANQ